jgi:hypothetical protein
MRPVCVFAEVPSSVRAQIMDLLHGRWRTATRLMMVVLSTAGISPAQIAVLLDYHPTTVCPAPGLMETSKPGRNTSDAGTEEVQR